MATINGHTVPDEDVDLFLNGETGEPISDEEWDEQKRRLADTSEERNWDELDENGDIA